MKKISCILLALLLLGVQQGVASEKQEKQKMPKQTAEQPTKKTKIQKMAAKGDGIAKGVLEALNPTPISIAAIHEYIQSRGCKSTLEEPKDAEKYITFQSDSLSGHIHAEGEYIIFQTNLSNPGSYVSRMIRQDKITSKAKAIVYRACLDLMNRIRCVKASYYEEDDWITIYIETYIPTMPIFERYFDTYMAILSKASDQVVYLLDQHIESTNK